MTPLVSEVLAPKSCTSCYICGDARISGIGYKKNSYFLEDLHDEWQTIEIPGDDFSWYHFISLSDHKEVLEIALVDLVEIAL